MSANDHQLPLRGAGGKTTRAENLIETRAQLRAGLVRAGDTQQYASILAVDLNKCTKTIFQPEHYLCELTTRIHYVETLTEKL